MIWNWQQPDWPTFQWDQVRLEAAEKQFLVNGGVFVGTVRHLGTEERDQLTIEAMSTEERAVLYLQATGTGCGRTTGAASGARNC